jgi:hypothetical protein
MTLTASRKSTARASPAGGRIDELYTRGPANSPRRDSSGAPAAAIVSSRRAMRQRRIEQRFSGE